MWKILYDDIFQLVLPPGCEIIAFADDTLLTITARQYNTLHANTNTALATLSDWAETKKLKFNATKTEAVFFGIKNNQVRPTFRLRNERIYCKDTIHYLGVTIDHKLSWKDHIREAAYKGKQIANKIAAIAKSTWGIKNKALILIYKGAVEPAITYAAPIWSEGVKTRESNLLLSAQRVLAVKAAYGYRTISTEASLILSNLLPLPFKLQEITQRRMVSSGQVGTLRELLELDEERPIENRIKDIQLGHPGRRKRPTFQITLPSHDDYPIQIFTDGSRFKDGGTGAAFISVYRGNIIYEARFRLHKGCSNFQGEVVAIAKALENIETNLANNDRFAIITDSRAALNAISEMRAPTGILLSTWETWRRITANNITVNFYWVQAHSGNKGNERADELAKSAAKDVNLPITYDAIPLSEIHFKIRRRLEREWEFKWANADTGRLTHKFIPSIAIRRKITIEFDSRLTQLVTGHGRFGFYFRRFAISEEDCCQCGEVDTAEHLILRCPQYEHQRRVLDAQLVQRGLSWPRTMAHITELATEEDWWKRLKEFANSIDRLLPDTTYRSRQSPD